MSKKHTAPETPIKSPMTDAEMAVKHNHDEVVSQLNAHFNGTDKEKKNALSNLDKAFGNLVAANEKVNG